MHVTETNTLSDIVKTAVIRLWNDEYPVQISNKVPGAFDKYLALLQDKKHYIAIDAGSVVGWALLFTRDGERWFAIIVSRDAQGKGYGTALLNKLKSSGEKLCGWVTDHVSYLRADGSVYPSPLYFYLRHRFTVTTQRLETSILSAVKIEWSPECE